jgi:hypothetical protein
MYDKANETTPQALVDAGFLFPTSKPSIADTLPDEWDALMEEKGIMGLTDVQLETYLEKWLRLLGHAYWVHSVWSDRVTVLQRLADYVKDYIFAHAEGSREQKGAIAGSHPIYLEVMEKLSEWERKRDELYGLIRKWEKIEFTISRTITNRQGKPMR